MSLELAQALHNEILRALPADVFQRLLPNLRLVRLAAGTVLHHAESRLDFIYFPLTCLISLFYLTRSGDGSEVAMIGREGVVGVASVLGATSSSDEAVIRLPGEALSVRATVVREEFSRADSLQRSLLRFTHSFIEQVSHVAVCNRLHSIEQRLSRWLLSCHDRIDCDVLHLTQEALGQVLGTRRESITVAAGELQDRGAIHYARGQIRILDRSKLLLSACECYHTLATAPVDRPLHLPARSFVRLPLREKAL